MTIFAARDRVEVADNSDYHRLRGTVSRQARKGGVAGYWVRLDGHVKTLFFADWQLRAADGTYSPVVYGNEEHTNINAGYACIGHYIYDIPDHECAGVVIDGTGEFSDEFSDEFGT